MVRIQRIVEPELAKYQGWLILLVTRFARKHLRGTPLDGENVLGHDHLDLQKGIVNVEPPVGAPTTLIK